MGFQLFSMLGALEVLDGIMPFLQEVFISIFFGYILYFLFIGISYIITFAQNLFNLAAGLGNISIFTGEKTGNQNVILDIFRNSSVIIVFWAVLGVCLILLVVFTIIAVIKTEFSMKFVSKAPIISRALTSLANFFMIPMMFIVGIVGVNALLTVVDKAVGVENRDEDSLAYHCFNVGSAGANRALLDSKFAEYLKGGTWLKRGTKNPFAGKENDDIVGIINKLFSKSAGNKSTETADLKGAIFVENSYLDRCEDSQDPNKYVDWHVSIIKYPDLKNGVSFYDLQAVNYFYNLASFNYILALGSGIVVAWSMLTVCLMLLKRIFEMLIIFLLSPIMTSVAPLDNGNAEKKLRGEFMKRLLAVIGPVFAYNLFFTIISIFSEASPFSALADESTFGLFMNTTVLAVFNVMFQIAVIIVGLGILKSANAMFCSILGIDDMLSQADANMKKTIGTVSKVALGATAGVGLAFKGTAAAAKFVKQGVPAVGKGIAAVGKGARGKFDMLTADRKQAKNDKVREELSTEESRYKMAEQQGDLEAMRMSSDKIRDLKGDMGKVDASDAKLASLRQRDDYKLRHAKQKLKFYKKKNSDEYDENEVMAEENKISEIKTKQSDERSAKFNKIKSSVANSAVGQFIPNRIKGAKTLLKDIYGADKGVMFGRLKESMFGLSNESGQAALGLLFKKDERKAFYKSKDEISAEKSKAEKKKEEDKTAKETELAFLRKSIAINDINRANAEKALDLYKKLETAMKDGVLSEQRAAKKKVEKFETENGITKQAEILHASINNSKDPNYSDNLSKLDGWLSQARRQAEEEGKAAADKDIQKQKEASKEAMGGTEEKLDKVIRGLSSLASILKNSSKNDKQKTEKS